MAMLEIYENLNIYTIIIDINNLTSNDRFLGPKMKELYILQVYFHFRNNWDVIIFLCKGLGGLSPCAIFIHQERGYFLSRAEQCFVGFFFLRIHFPHTKQFNSALANFYCNR